MSIKITPNGTFRVRLKYPVDVATMLGLKNNNFDKIYKTRREAEQAEKDLKNKITALRQTKDTSVFELNGEKTVEQIYFEDWLEAYKNGFTSSYPKPPDLATIRNTEDIFRLHILPMFGKYTLNHLNQNKRLVIRKMTIKANEYANFKTLRGYVNQIFDLAEEYGYIESNRLTNSLKKIKSTKKQALAAAKSDNSKYLDEEELSFWIQAINEDYENNFLTELDYTMFWTTFFLTCRKSETYALQWKHIDFNNSRIYLVQALDKFGNVKTTKGNKKTIINIPEQLKSILEKWKETQKEELMQFNIKQTSQQFLFTFQNNSGEINKCVHTDFLNYRMKSVKKRHPHLQNASPHKLRHTAASLAKIHGMSLEEISKGLTHSDTVTTTIYVNNEEVVSISPAEFAFNHLKINSEGK
ncbi:tyrosine-type recombinase/integrase [Vagococcus fluvialis]|uniref:Tyrosine-type recombinase/integrase n=1 Tax=Vagococcus fluvialis TaxID=2738 RepID=A0A7X6D957_9ENTE|nr:tyrosine-type recombinase/integrase [Vagococcus fluvialis]NKC68052.1 tyrosine-type recombinase/integrase [Vagococcus fluvialis]